MNTHESLVMVKGVVKTSTVSSIFQGKEKTKISYKDDKVYTYSSADVVYLKNPKLCRISEKKKDIYKEVLLFEDKVYKIYHIFLKDDADSEYDVLGTCPVLNYLKEIATVPQLVMNNSNADADEDEDEPISKLLPKQYSSLLSVREDSALYRYLTKSQIRKENEPKEIIFPFGCNKSQVQAVKNALINQISIIQGPPGTGKTQTILNIISNLILQGKNVLVVSNNNSAIENIAEKFDRYGLKFVSAKLGKEDNKIEFFAAQQQKYPSEFYNWKLINIFQENMSFEYIRKLEKGFEQKELLSKKQKEFEEIETEKFYFNQFYKSQFLEKLSTRKIVSPKKIANLWQKLQNKIDSFPRRKTKKLSFLKRCYYSHCLGVNKKNLHCSYQKFILILQRFLYESKELEIKEEIKKIHKNIEENNIEELMKSFSEYSMNKLKKAIYDHYRIFHKNDKREDFSRQIFAAKTLSKDTKAFLKEYPLTLSTTFSSKNNIDNKYLYDYVIMDEASQVDIATGALALSMAKNAVIVGDSMQLPNVVSSKDRKKLQFIFDCHKGEFDSGYNSAEYSFLDSMLKVLPEIPQTLLREHYRCHPKIIEFCNQKFYNGQLIAMTKDNGEPDVLNVVKTVKGNHCREDHVNIRQIDCLSNDILLKMGDKREEIGVIAPYRTQVSETQKSVSELAESTATVHKFQGREKNVIIFMTTDDKVNSFSDDSNLLNVAISRAKNKFFLITSGEEHPRGSNIRDLISYIEYKNGTITQSNVRSVFDFLYKEYRISRLEYLKSHKKVSEYDSENLMYSVIEDVMKKEEFCEYDVVCHQPLNQLIVDFSLISDPVELKYAKHPATHLDFLIFNRITKKPFLAIEVDGYTFHKKGSKQNRRDLWKNHILDLYLIPLIRFSTRDSEIEKKLNAKMCELMN